MAHFLLENIERVDLLGTTFLLTKDAKGNPYVSVPDLCNSIGLDVAPQVDRLMQNPIFQGARIPLETEDGTVEVIGVPLITLHTFLFTMPEDGLDDECLARLVFFKMHCTSVLSDYWNKGAAINDRIQRGGIDGLPVRSARRVSKPALVKACQDLSAAYPDIDPEDAYHHIISFCYDRLDRGPLMMEEQMVDDTATWGVDQYLLAAMELTAAELIDITIKEDRDPNEIVTHLEGELANKLHELGERAFELAQ